MKRANFLLGALLLALLWSGNTMAAACTSVATGNWGTQTTWGVAGTGCVGAAGGIPGAADTVTVVSPHTVTLNNNYSATSLTVNLGATLRDNGNRLTITGSAVIDGTFGRAGDGGRLIMTGAGQTLSGNGTFIDVGRIQIDGNTTIPAGSNLKLTLGSEIRVGSGAAANLTLNGAIDGTGQTVGNRILRVYNASTVTINGSITAANAFTEIRAGGTVVNNGTATLQYLSGLNAATSIWTNAANSTLNISTTLLTTGAGGVLNASAAGNTVNYNGAAQTVKVPSGAPAAYYNLTFSGSGAKTVGATTINGNFTMSGTATTAPTGAFTVAGNFTIGATNTFTAGASAHSVGGDWSNSGTFTAGAGTVTFTGANSTLGGTVATTFNNLIVNKTAGNDLSIACLTPSPTVNATLTLTSGDIVTCASACAAQVPIIVAAGGTIAGGSATSYVQGALRKMFNAAATLNFRAAGLDEFPVGDATNYSPVEISAGTTSTAGSVTACVTPADHPQVTTPVVTTGIDAAKSVNRYWSLTTATINTTAVLVDATFKFVAGDVDAGATTANFVIEEYGTYWNPTTLVNAAATSTRAQNIDLTSAVSTNNEIAIGEPLSGFTALPGRYNAFETATSAGAILGKVQTKVAGTGFSVDVVHINTTKTGVLAGAITVEVRLLDSSGGGVLDADGCNAAWPLIQALPNFNIPASGRGTLPAATVANSYRSVRFQIRSPVGGPYTQIGCSTDLFAIRPASLTISAHDATWATAGTTRPLANTGASGGNVHKAATDLSPLPFTLRATPLPVTATNYDGNPTTVAAFPTCGTLCTTVGTLSFTAGSWTTTPALSGVRENATANYSEAGTFNLQLEDATYAVVDAVDGTLPATRTVPATASVEIGRFVPDHFGVTLLVTPQFKTFNATDAACSAGAAPRRTFTYIGQPFGYSVAPQATVVALNAAGATTTNYSGSLWKIGGTSSSSKDCTTDPNFCVFTSSWSGVGIDSSVVENYAYTLNPVSTPGWDNAGAFTAAATVTPGAGTGTIAISSSDTLAFLRSITTPQAAFTAKITDTLSVTDASENAVANNGIIATTAPLVFDGAVPGSGIAFDAGNEFRYGRLKLSNAYGSELLGLPVPIKTQYWDGAISAFVTNSADNCTSLIPGNIKLNPVVAGVNPTVGGAFTSGVGSLTLTKPTVAAKVAVDLCVDLGADPGVGTVCSATSAVKPYLQGLWAPGSNYDNDPAARATFGVYKGANEFIYLRENY